MTSTNPVDNSLGELFGQLVEDGRNLVTSEIGLYKQVALYRVGKAGGGIGALVAGGLLGYAGLIALLVGFVLGLAELVGPVAGGLIVFVVVAIIAFLLVRYGLSKVGALSGDPDEKAAIAAGERLS